MTFMQEPAVKDENAEHPVGSAWRPTLCEIVKAFARGDYALKQGVPFVAPVSAETARQIERYVADYGETLCELPTLSGSGASSGEMSCPQLAHANAVTTLGSIHKEGYRCSHPVKWGRIRVRSTRTRTDL